MKIYYSNLSSIKLPDEFPQVGVLISYWGLKTVNKPLWCDDLFLDSGAFSAFNKKSIINLQQYIDFVQTNKHLFKIYASLDDIASYRNSLNNYEEIKKQSLDPLPCFHIGEPEWVLDEYLTKTSYIALGGIAKQNQQTRKKWLDWIFNKYPDQTVIGFHGFGIQARDILMTYPWRSVDSSSACVMARFGGICTPWGDFKINKSVAVHNLNWVSNMNEEILKQWANELSPIINYDVALKGTLEGSVMRTMINIIYYEQLKKQVISKFIKKINFGFGFYV